VGGEWKTDTTTQGMALRTGPSGTIFIRLVLAEGYLLADRASEAAEVAAWILASTRECGDRGHEAYAQRMLGNIAANEETADFEAAETHYLDAQRLAMDLGMRPLAAHCHLGRVKLYRRMG
jgi:hypothetical protein